MQTYWSRLAIAVLALAINGQAAGPPVKPNIVFIRADDLGMQDVGFTGSTSGNPPCSVVRKSDWKLIPFRKKENVELYDLRPDLKASHNLATENPEMTAALLRGLTAWRAENEAPLLPNSQPGG